MTATEEETVMLAEIFILRLEASLRTTGKAKGVSSSQHVPFNPASFTSFKVRGVAPSARA